MILSLTDLDTHKLVQLTRVALKKSGLIGQSTKSLELYSQELQTQIDDEDFFFKIGIVAVIEELQTRGLKKL